MENLLLVGILFLLLLGLYIFNKSFSKIEEDLDLLRNYIRELNTKIDNLKKGEKEENVTELSKTSSISEEFDSLKAKKKEEKITEHSKTPSTFDEFIPPEKEKREEVPQKIISSGIQPSIRIKENVNPITQEDKIKQLEAQKVKRDKNTKSPLDIEKLFGENILSKIGITTLVLGIAYFVKYAIDQNWIGEGGRVGIGILTGFIIIGIAHKLREKYLSFSGLLAGGGISVLYITITLAFREYELFSQTTAFILLIGITVLSVALSLYYDQKILAIFSILGGFASPLLVSSDSGNYVTLFSYIFILNTGMLILAYRKKWIAVSLLSYVLTYVFYIFWLVFSYKIENRNGAVIFGVLFFIQFYLLVLIEYFKIRKITSFQVFIILSNNFLLYITLFYLFMDYPINTEYKTNSTQGLITLVMAIINTIPVLLLIKIREKDTLFFRLLVGIVITFASLVIPIQFHGFAITMFWGAEAVLLLWLFKRTRIDIFIFSYLVLQILAFGSLFIDYYETYYSYTQVLPILLNSIFITGALVTGYLAISLQILKKEKSYSVSIWGEKLFSIAFLTLILNQILVFLIFIFPFTELSHQLYQRDFDFYEMLLIQGMYIYLFFAILILIRKYKFKKVFYSLIFLLSLLYPVVYLYSIVFEIISNRILSLTNNFSYKIFLLHFLTIPAFIIFQIYLCKKNIFKNKESIYWMVAVISMLALSLEIDNIVLMFYSIDVLENVHTIVYSVVWGIVALILMITGIKYKDLIFRKISLGLFVLIILKLYLYDVWKMPQAGKIISFVLLGIILLGTSFLYQKLKVLINEEDIENKNENKN